MLDSENASGLKLGLVELKLASMHFKNKKHYSIHTILIKSHVYEEKTQTD